MTRPHRGRPASERSLVLADGNVTMTTIDEHGEAETATWETPPGSVFDPNSRPDPYCAANHILHTQVTSGDTWYKKRAGHVTDFWVLDNGVIVRVVRHREPYELELLEYQGPKPAPGTNPGRP